MIWYVTVYKKAAAANGRTICFESLTAAHRRWLRKAGYDPQSQSTGQYTSKDILMKFKKVEGANVVLRDYHSADMHCGGWVNYGISQNSVKKSTEEAKKLIF